MRLIFLLQDEMADQLFLHMAIHFPKVYRMTSLALEKEHLNAQIRITNKFIWKKKKMRHCFSLLNPTQFFQMMQNRKLVPLFHAWCEGISNQEVPSCSNETIRNFSKHRELLLMDYFLLKEFYLETFIL